MQAKAMTCAAAGSAPRCRRSSPECSRSAPEAGLDWPVRLLVQQDANGDVWAIYTDFGWIARCHGIANRDQQFNMATGVVAVDHVDDSSAAMIPLVHSSGPHRRGGQDDGETT